MAICIVCIVGIAITICTGPIGVGICILAITAFWIDGRKSKDQAKLGLQKFRSTQVQARAEDTETEDREIIRGWRGPGRRT